MHLKEKVLAALLAAKGEYCSGAEIADTLHVTRTSVWKAIEQLRLQGCEIDAVRNKGYRLVTAPDIYNQEHMQSLLKNTMWQVQHFSELDSTNRLAKEIAPNAPSGTVILADRQTSGRGRLGKQFHSPTGGLYFSVIIRPDLPLSSMMGVTACTATAVHTALEETGVYTRIKWVNDLMLNGKKICGILSEGSFNAELLKMDYLVIGIGINLSPDPCLPDELKSIITDIQSETGIKLDRFQILADILRSMEFYFAHINTLNYLQNYTEHSYTLGNRVRTDKGIEGLAVGFTKEAGLIIRLDDETDYILTTGSAQIINKEK